MTFKEYVNQKDPIHLYPGSVSVDEDDCYMVRKAFNMLNVITGYGEWAYQVTLVIGNMHIEYLKLPQSDTLYTMDEDGNKKRMSVFKLNFEL